MIRWGITALNHGSSLARLEGTDVRVWKSSSDDPGPVISEALKQGRPQEIYWYERPWSKKLRQLRAAQFSRAFDLGDLPWLHLAAQGLIEVPIHYALHHHSHAAAGYYTSEFTEAAVVVIDGLAKLPSFRITPI